MGVDLFFVLSGFVITMTYCDSVGPRFSGRIARSFLWARISRVWPVHALVATLFGGWLLWKSTKVTDGNVAYQSVQPELDLPHLVEQLLMVQLWHRPSYQGASFAGPAWSLSAEWLAYVCFPLVALVLWRLRHARPAVTGALAITALLPMALLSVADGGLGFGWSWLLRIAGGFLSGAFASLTVRRIAPSARAGRAATTVATATVAAIVVGLWWADWRGAGSAAGNGGAVAFLFPVLVGSLALAGGGPARLLGTRAMVLGGRISFALYLVHVPVFEIFWTEMGWHPRIAPDTRLSLLLMPVVLLGTLLLAHLMFRFVEEPARRWLRRHEPGAGRSAAAGGVPADPVPTEPRQTLVLLRVPRHPAASAAARTVRTVRAPKGAADRGPAVLGNG